MAKIKVRLDGDNTVLATADVFVNGTLRKVTAKAELKGDGGLADVEAWRQVVFSIYEMKDARQNAVSEPKGGE